MLTACVLCLHVVLAQASDASTAEARARFKEGVTLYDRGDYEAARAKFKQAYALKHHPSVLLNLGWSDVKSGHREEAEDAFRAYLRVATDAPPSQRAEAERGLEEARVAPAATATTSAAFPTERAETPAAPATTAPTAPAEGALPIVASALVGYSTNELNFGLGVRGGKVVVSRVYLGGAFVYNFGRSQQTRTLTGQVVDASFSAFYVGPEAGYDFDLAPFVVRPYAGLGLASLTASGGVPGATVSASDTRFIVWPGVMGLYDMPGSSFTLGADARLVFVPGGPAFGVFGTGGMRF